jgi:hypothetical protein
MNKARLVNNRAMTYAVIFGNLLLFSLSLALSRSAVRVLMTLICLTIMNLAIRSRNHRSTVVSYMNQPLVLPLPTYFAMAVLGIYPELFGRTARGIA